MRASSTLFGMTLVACLGFAAACTVTTTSHDDGKTADAGKSKTSDAGTDKGTDKGTGSGSGSLCDKSCAASADADCKKASSCVADCEAQLDKVPEACKEKAEAALTCAASASSFKCNSSGAAVVDGECETEGQALLTCITKGGDDEDPNACGQPFFKDSACETCRKDKCCVESAACDSNSACIDILECISDNECADQDCVDQCEAQHSAGKSAEVAFYSCLQDQCASECQ